MADYRAALGRGSDNQMAHMTPGEAVIPRGSMTPKLWAAYQEALDRQGMAPEQYVVGSGHNSVNPMTGQPEFLAQAAGPGRAVREYREHSSNPTGRDPRESGAADPLRFPVSPEMGGSPARTSQQGMIEHVPQKQWATDGGQFGSATPLDVGAILGGVGGGLLGGPVGGAGGAALGTGEFDLDVFTEYDPYGPVGSGSLSGVGAESQADRQAFTAGPGSLAPSFTRPASLPTPGFLDLSSAMTPLQMRSAIASRAVAGQGGQYTSPEAQSYYDNLLQQLLINEDGTLNNIDTLLPIDLQYLAQIRGIEGPSDTSALLGALQ